MNNSSAESSNQIKKIKNIDIPSPNLLRNLAVSESGFVFNPSSGHSFSVNETGLKLWNGQPQQNASHCGRLKRSAPSAKKSFNVQEE